MAHDLVFQVNGLNREGKKINFYAFSGKIFKDVLETFQFFSSCAQIDLNLTIFNEKRSLTKFLCPLLLIASKCRVNFFDILITLKISKKIIIYFVCSEK